MPPKTTKAPRARASARLVAAQRVGRVDPDADHVAGVDGATIEVFQRLVDDVGACRSVRCRGREHDSQRGVMTAVPNESHWD